MNCDTYMGVLTLSDSESGFEGNTGGSSLSLDKMKNESLPISRVHYLLLTY